MPVFNSTKLNLTKPSCVAKFGLIFLQDEKMGFHFETCTKRQVPRFAFLNDISELAFLS